MAYLGRGIENLSDRVVLDSLTASATASYTLQLNSVNFVPSSAESLTVSLNGVIQAPISSYTVSGSTLTFASALTSSDSIDFIIAERGITLQTPSAGSVTNSSIASNAGIATTKLGTGAVLQVVNSTTSTEVTVTGSTFTDTTLTASITPISTSSKILILTSQSYYVRRASSAYGLCGARLLRGTTTIWNPNPEDSSGSYGHGIVLTGTSTTTSAYGTIDFNYLDSPSTTSATTYKTQIRSYTSTGVVSAQQSGPNTDAKSSITLMEIAG